MLSRIARSTVSPLLLLLAGTISSTASISASTPPVTPQGGDLFFGDHGDGAALYPAFDADFPVVATGKNCSACGGRDGCAGCLCAKGCVPNQINESLPFISRTLGSHMVLQRAPATAMVYGHAKLGATVTTTFRGRSYTTTTDDVDVGGGQGIGTWRQALPPTPGGKTAYTLTFTSSAGDHGNLSDVLFGEVYFCSGQSNMEDPMLTQINATEECERANSFPTIRLFTVNDDNPGRAYNHGGPEHDLQNVMQPWMVAANTSLCRRENSTSYVTIPPKTSLEWHGGDFSAMCWFFGRQISEGLSPTGEVPIGLVASDWGGTALSQWTPADAVADCALTANCTGKGWIGGDHYNAMVHPFTVGPMALSGFAWYQGENGAGGPTGTDGPCSTLPTDPKSVDPIWAPNGVINGNALMYNCLFPAMVKAWRRAFKVPDAYFGFVQLASWMQMGHGAQRDPYGNGDRTFAIGVPAIRQAQMSAAALPRVGYAVYADCGEGELHPTNKWRPGARLGNSALAIQYGKAVPWISPTYESASVATVGGVVSVTITLGNATALQTKSPFNVPQCGRQMRCVDDADGLHHGTPPHPPPATATPAPATTAATAAATAASPGNCTFMPDCDYSKGKGVGSATVNTREQCCSLCATRPGCAAGVFDGATCWFKSSKDIAGGCHRDTRALFACLPQSVHPGPPPPPPPAPPAQRHCIPANVSAGWAGYPQNVGGDCGWAAVQSRFGGWANATVHIKGTQLVLEVPTVLIKGEVVATSYGWGVYAMISTYTAAEVAGGGGGIPVLPWNKTL